MNRKRSLVFLSCLLVISLSRCDNRPRSFDGLPAGGRLNDGGGETPTGRADGGAPILPNPGVLFGDAGTPSVTGGDAGRITDNVAPGCPTGSIYGRACAPSGRVYLAGAVISVDASDCQGNVVHRQVTADADGFYRLDGVPAGEVDLHIRKGTFATSARVRVPPGGVLDIAEQDQKVCLSRDAARIAVMTGAFDKVERILDQLGLTYTTYDGTDESVPTGLSLLLDPLQLSRYDIVLINCGINYWSTHANNPTRWQQILTNLRNYVSAGGSLYVSDWAFRLVEDAWPGFVDFNGDDTVNQNVTSGYAPQTVTATVLNAELERGLGHSTVSISFPNQFPDAISNNWALMTGAAPETEVLLRADVRQCRVISSCYEPGTTHTNAPLLVSFRPNGTGRVIFTSFHFETVATETVLSLLRYLVFLF